MGRFGAVLTVVAIAAAIGPLMAQSPEQKRLTFEVASVKPSSGPPTRRYDIVLGYRGTDNRNVASNVPNGRCEARFATLRMLVALAYDLPIASGSKLAGGPDWGGSLSD